MRPSKILTFSFLTLLMIALTVGCTQQPATDLGDGNGGGGGEGDGGGSGGVNPGGSAPITVDEKYLDCNTATDCKVLEVGCCDICNGGGGIAVNKVFADEAYKKYKKICSPNWICTAMACPPPVAYCKDKKCAFLKSTNEARRCQKNEDCIIVKGGCCDHCNGGSLDAINKEFVDLYHSVPEFTNPDCSQIICTKEPCYETVATCSSDYCSFFVK